MAMMATLSPKRATHDAIAYLLLLLLLHDGDSDMNVTYGDSDGDCDR